MNHWLRDKISYENLDEMKHYLTEQIKTLDTEKILPFTCDSKDHSFMISEIVLYQVKDKDKENSKILGLEVHYKIYHCDYSEHMIYDIMDLRDADDIVHAIFYCLYDMELCRECFKLTDSKHQLCMSCIPQKIREEYARIHKNQEGHACVICLEPVYTSALSCGHFFHKTCFVKQNCHRWYSTRAAKSLIIKCPLCRQQIHEEDKYNFFLYREDE